MVILMSLAGIKSMLGGGHVSCVSRHVFSQLRIRSMLIFVFGCMLTGLVEMVLEAGSSVKLVHGKIHVHNCHENDAIYLNLLAIET